MQRAYHCLHNWNQQLKYDSFYSRAQTMELTVQIKSIIISIFLSVITI